MDARKHARGFTLIEILIALLIFTLVSAMIATALYALISIRKQLTAEQKRLASLQMTEVILQRDITQVILQPIYRQRRVIQPLTGKGGELHFIRGGHANPLAREERSNLLVVRYQLTPQGQLLRLSKVYPYGKQVRQVLLSGVRELHWRYLGKHQHFYTLWPVINADKRALGPPRAVEITLQLTEGQLVQLIQVG